MSIEKELLNALHATPKIKDHAKSPPVVKMNRESGGGKNLANYFDAL